MTEIELNIEFNSNEPEQFILADDDFYDDRCGEIFITTNKLLVLKCFVCGNKYGNSPNFIEHWIVQHGQGSLSNEAEYSSDAELELVKSSDDYVDDEEAIEYEFLSDEETKDLQLQLNIKTEEEYVSIDNTSITSELMNEETTEKIEIKNLNDDEKKQRMFMLNPRIGYKCDKCSKRFAKQKTLRHHLKEHEEEYNFKCTQCNIFFKAKINLTRHLQRHSGERNYACDFCEKKFFSSTQAKIHMRIHTGERPFICSQCGKACISASDLHTHTLRHSSFRPHKCNFCDKAFYRKVELKNHISVHSQERPFACPFCTDKFRRRNTLQAHIKIHENNREYECHLCEKSFNQRPALVTHLKQTHKLVK